MLFSIPFSHQPNANEHHRARHAQSSPITLFLLSKNQSHRKSALQEYRSADQFHAHGSAHMGLPIKNVYTARISRMQVN